MQEKELNTNLNDTLIRQISSVFGELIEGSPNLWCSEMARWCVTLLGRWSVEWEGVLVDRDATLEERVAKWLNCPPSCTLANLIVSCIAQNADIAMAALLEENIRSGPCLNWLVAHVGCSFPGTIVNRILYLGLVNFANAESSDEVRHRLVSVDIVLSHLAERHFLEIQRELHSLWINSSKDQNENVKKAVVPFLLKLASINKSKVIIRALAANLRQIIESEKLFSFSCRAQDWWIPKYFPNLQSLTDILTRLLCNLDDSSACEIISLLLETSSSPSVKGKQPDISDQLYEYLIFELTSIVYSNANISHHRPVSLLKSLGDGTLNSYSADGKMALNDVIKWALNSGNGMVIKRTSQIVSMVIHEQSPDVSCSILQSHLKSDFFAGKESIFFINAVISSMVKRQSSQNNNKPLTSISLALSNNFQRGDEIFTVVNTVKKLNSLLVGTKDKLFIHQILLEALVANILPICKYINVPLVSVDILELLCCLPLERPLSLKESMTLCHAVVYNFFSSLKLSSSQKKLKSYNLSSKILSQLAHSSVAHSLLIRLIFESVVSSEWSYLLGSKGSSSTLETKESPHQLLLSNLEFDSWVRVPKSHNMQFHAGRIGRLSLHAKRIAVNPKITEDDVNMNTQLVLNLLGDCCRPQGMNHGATTLALLLVEYISPDIMFNGFPWPEEYIKFTFERDLAIKKTFDDIPIAWHFLELVARYRPALCYCSVLVRALTAALTAFWNTCPLSSASQAESTILSTKKLLQIMCIGQFLPDAFAVLPQMVSSLAPHEVVCVLQDIWAYLRDHTPSPDRWVLLPFGVHQRPAEPLDPRYTDRIRKLIHVHIDLFGHLLPSLINPPSCR